MNQGFFKEHEGRTKGQGENLANNSRIDDGTKTEQNRCVCKEKYNYLMDFQMTNQENDGISLSHEILVKKSIIIFLVLIGNSKLIQLLVHNLS